MLKSPISNRLPSSRSLLVVVILLGLIGLVPPVSADDCDNWGRVVQVGLQSGDDLCTLRAGAQGGVTRRLEDKFDYDYFVFYVGYDVETSINVPYIVTMAETSLSRPKIVVGVFYDNASLRLPGQAYEDAQTTSDFWYDAHGSGLGLTANEFRNMVTLEPNLQHDGVYDYVDGEIVVVQESSDAAIRQMFYAVPVGTILGTNIRGEHLVNFTPPDRGAYIVVVNNYNPTRRRGTLTGSYKLTVSHE